MERCITKDGVHKRCKINTGECGFCGDPMPADARERRRLRAVEAEAKSSQALGDANEATERGNHAAAERLLQRAQRWLDKANRLRGNGDGA